MRGARERWWLNGMEKCIDIVDAAARNGEKRKDENGREGGKGQHTHKKIGEEQVGLGEGKWMEMGGMGEVGAGRRGLLTGCRKSGGRGMRKKGN